MEIKQDGFSHYIPPYEVGEFLHFPNSWPSLYEVLSPGHGDPLTIKLSGDSVAMSPFTVFRVSIGPTVGGWVHMVKTNGHLDYVADTKPPASIVDYMRPGAEEPVRIDARAIPFLESRG